MGKVRDLTDKLHYKVSTSHSLYPQSKHPVCVFYSVDIKDKLSFLLDLGLVPTGGGVEESIHQDPKNDGAFLYMIFDKQNLIARLHNIFTTSNQEGRINREKRIKEVESAASEWQSFINFVMSSTNDSERPLHANLKTKYGEIAQKLNNLAEHNSSTANKLMPQVNLSSAVYYSTDKGHLSLPTIVNCLEMNLAVAFDSYCKKTNGNYFFYIPVTVGTSGPVVKEKTGDIFDIQSKLVGESIMLSDAESGRAACLGYVLGYQLATKGSLEQIRECDNSLMTARGQIRERDAEIQKMALQNDLSKVQLHEAEVRAELVSEEAGELQAALKEAAQVGLAKKKAALEAKEAELKAAQEQLKAKEDELKVLEAQSGQAAILQKELEAKLKALETEIKKLQNRPQVLQGLGQQDELTQELKKKDALTTQELKKKEDELQNIQKQLKAAQENAEQVGLKVTQEKLVQEAKLRQLQDELIGVQQELSRSRSQSQSPARDPGNEELMRLLLTALDKMLSDNSKESGGCLKLFEGDQRLLAEAVQLLRAHLSSPNDARPHVDQYPEGREQGGAMHMIFKVFEEVLQRYSGDQELLITLIRESAGLFRQHLGTVEGGNQAQYAMIMKVLEQNSELIRTVTAPVVAAPTLAAGGVATTVATPLPTVAPTPPSTVAGPAPGVPAPHKPAISKGVVTKVPSNEEFLKQFREKDLLGVIPQVLECEITQGLWFDEGGAEYLDLKVANIRVGIAGLVCVNNPSLSVSKGPEAMVKAYVNYILYVTECPIDSNKRGYNHVQVMPQVVESMCNALKFHIGTTERVTNLTSATDRSSFASGSKPLTIWEIENIGAHLRITTHRPSKEDQLIIQRALQISISQPVAESQPDGTTTPRGMVYRVNDSKCCVVL